MSDLLDTRLILSRIRSSHRLGICAATIFVGLKLRCVTTGVVVFHVNLRDSRSAIRSGDVGLHSSWRPSSFVKLGVCVCGSSSHLRFDTTNLFSLLVSINVNLILIHFFNFTLDSSILFLDELFRPRHFLPSFSNSHKNVVGRIALKCKMVIPQNSLALRTISVG